MLRRRSSFSIPAVLAAAILLDFAFVYGFNLDVYAPIYKYGQENTYFGFTVAEHFKVDQPVVLVGAPRAESGQVGTVQAGALFACPINTRYTGNGSEWCEQIRSEYEDISSYSKSPDMTLTGREAHYLGKNGELLGASLASQGTRKGGAVNTMVTGLIGAMKWTGGVYARMAEGGIFGTTTEKYTMAPEEGGVRTMLAAHDYLGYSVDVGRFGFWYEKGQRSTIVSGATRFGQHGAVIFLPFTKDRGDLLTFTEDRFHINGTKMGSAFGYSVEVVDLNNDGFDDLIVGAPFEHRSDSEGHFGGVVYVYYSQGVERKKFESSKVFHPPIVLKVPGPFSQFGLSISKLGNVDGDKDGFNDFAVGAPFANDGTGAVYIFLGEKSRKDFRRTPSQVIIGSDLPNLRRPMKSFGFSLSGGSDLDGNGYPDLAVGAVTEGVVTILRSRPVISISAHHKTASKFIDIEKGKNCPRGAKTCFPLDLEISVDRDSSKGADLVDFNSNVFTCNLEVIPVNQGVPLRAHIDASASTNHSWPCGQGAHRNTQKYTEVIYIPEHDDSVKDWINPLKFRFTVQIKNERKPLHPAEGRPLVDLKQYPILNKYGASYEFQIPFNTRCGEDHVCETDLSLKAVFVDIPKTEKGYVSNVGDKDFLDITFTVQNKKEKAYQAALYLTYDPEELELPTIVGKTKLGLETVGKNVVVVYLGNPMDAESKHSFDLRFKLVRGRTEGIGRPLQFSALVNSTSSEVNLGDNVWKAELQIIKKAELELIGTSDPPLVRFGGEYSMFLPLMSGLDESSMDLEEDIGVMVRHNYTLHNKGPWTVRNVVAKFDWPYQVESTHAKGKWALYLLDVPTVTMHNTDGSVDIRRCSVERKLEHVNPLDHIKLNTKYTTQETVSTRTSLRQRVKRETQALKLGEAGFLRKRIEPHKRKENGVDVSVVTIGCAESTAKCFSVTCHFDFLDANSAPVIDFRARLWNSTFIEDYSDVEYVEITSFGRIELDTSQGIEDDPGNNAVSAKTIAYPDRPALGSRPIPWWVILVSILIGLLILLIVVLILWRCGFFKRKKYGEPSLYRAELQHEREQWNQTQM
ncbi:FG-GAP repeat protein [Ancylostoma ceylanicum]|uniref:FG-GAP repeat protein n=1 Tax=Ancylostoma ceylanicum TaxID=53326 RepID=A0A0D6LJB1_9BILA|nr:FG-GAP repeat protein [Ancylostoma ceylanicum]